MLQLILASIGFIPWGMYIILTYYSKNFSQIDHLESASGYSGYLLGLGFVYGIYKTISLLSSKKNVSFGFWHILGFSILQILLISIAYTGGQNVIGSPFFSTVGLSSLTLFGHILSLLIYPVFLAFLWRAIGFSCLKWIRGWGEIDIRVRIGVEISIGLAVFIIGLLLIGVLGIFTLTSLIYLCGILTIASFFGWIETWRDIQNRAVILNQHDNKSGSILDTIHPRLLSIEFAFIVVSFLIAISLVNAIRPMPIGWDDLGVYMNWPRIIAVTGSALEGTGLYAWQLVTASGFLWDQIAANAFYVNQLGGILSIIVITSILSYLFEGKNTKYIISLPLLLAGIYYMMPMTIFQQAKDMKIDPALMMVSVSAFGILWYGLHEKFQKKGFYYFIGIAGIIVGLAFSMKLTTLILIISSLALIAYRMLGLSGFLGFFFIFLAIFTGGNLWGKMNVWMPTTNTELIYSIAGVLLLCGGVGITIAIVRRGRESVLRWLMTNIVFILGIAITLTPWFIKNGLESQTFTSSQKGGTLDSLLGGYGSTGWDNYAAIYSTEEYATKRKDQQSESITNDGKSKNEDFSRYFGQESGLNNYLKLPANLTFQKNQNGEFTDITYIFLALLPSILLYIPGRRIGKKYWTTFLFPVVIAVGMIGMILYYFIGSTGAMMSAQVNDIELPLGYAFILGGILFTIILTHFTIDYRSKGIYIQDIIVMLMVYGFLFVISAFGIVWYGVFLYFLCIALIGLVALTFVSYSDEDTEDTLGVKVTLSAIFFLFIFIYIVRSAFPHGWNNLMASGMNEYKYNKLDQNESIFTYRSDYITPISAMNVLDPNAVTKRAALLAETSVFKKILTPELLENMEPNDLHQILLYFITQLESGKMNLEKQAIKNDIKKVGNELYSSILSPKGTDVNNKGIYRIGTFMTYLINKNQQRYLEDSLIFEFETFFYDPSPEKTIERMQKVGLGYLLTDLNAATIDRDPRRALTTRFEHLLLTMRAGNLRLIDTDNLCLKVGISEYKAGRLQTDTEFIDIAGTNYESYRGADMKPVLRTEKQNKCANYVVKILNSAGQSGATVPDYLIPLQSSLKEAKNQAEQQNILSRTFGQSYFALFEIIDSEEVKIPGTTKADATSTGTLQ